MLRVEEIADLTGGACDRFDLQAFQEFVLAQGLLPPDILNEAVMNEFVASQLD